MSTGFEPVRVAMHFDLFNRPFVPDVRFIVKGGSVLLLLLLLSSSSSSYAVTVEIVLGVGDGG